MDPMSKLPPIATVPSLSTEDRASILDLLFEPSPALHTLAVPTLHQTTFASYPDLIATVGVQLTALAQSASTSDTAWLHAILAAHPRLGAARVASAQSQAEQAPLQQAGGADEREVLARLNDEYEARFPGLRYVVFVAGRPRAAIVDDMRRRIDGGDVEAEQAAAIRAICEIAADRAAKLV